MQKFRKKPIYIEAVLFDRDNEKEITQWANTGRSHDSPVILPALSGILGIVTPEGEMSAAAGDWIIKNENGDFYPCKPNIFANNYEPVD